MLDWYDLRIFLAIARKGSIRAAADALQLDHSTVSRRIRAFEKRLGVQLMDRLPTGYVPTAAGEELIAEARTIEDQLTAIERRVLGQDERLSGELRVSLPATLALYALMPDLTAFTARYPNIDLVVRMSYEHVSLTRREADVAIRFTNHPPEHLVGHRLLTYANAAYASVEYIASHNAETMTWVGWDEATPSPPWIATTPFPTVPARHCVEDPALQVEAVKAGLGIGWLQCFIADQEPQLRRLFSGHPTPGRDMWILTHADLRHTTRVSVFMDFIAQAIRAQRNLFEGRKPIAKPTKISRQKRRPS